MYEHFYGFTARPFQLTPDPRFWFESATHRTAMSYLGYGLAQGEGFIVITGEVGSGKTTLVGHVLQSIDPSRMTAARLVSTQIADADLLRLVCDAFGIAIPSPAKSDALAAIETFLHEEARAGRRVLLIVDEAQNLAISALEELRMLSNFQLGETSLMQIFLLGQPEFRATLASARLEQLRQRVIATHHLEAMLPEEVEPYLIHRLSLVGWKEDPALAPSAYDALWQASAGVPRRINTIASRLLLHGAVEELHELDGEDVRTVVADMGLSREDLTAPVPSFGTAPAPADAPAAVSAPEPVVESAPTTPAAAAMPQGHHAEAAPGFSVADFARPPEVAPPPPAPPVALVPPAPRLPDDAEINALRAQLAALEARCSEQDAAIRRILGLLIQWVEDDEAPRMTGRAA
jgi:putative secretion ATPase (PEP-CTERM system associated)